MPNSPKKSLRFSQRTAIKCVKGYQWFRHILDLACVSVFGIAIACKHSPTCSDYTIKQIMDHGTIYGSILGAKRLLSCW